MYIYTITNHKCEVIATIANNTEELITSTLKGLYSNFKAFNVATSMLTFSDGEKQEIYITKVPVVVPNIEYNRKALVDGLLIEIMAVLSDIQENELSDGSQQSNKVYNWIEEDILAVKILYLGDLSDDSTMAEEIQAEGGEMTQLEALDLLKVRLNNTIEYLG